MDVYEPLVENNVDLGHHGIAEIPLSSRDQRENINIIQYTDSVTNEWTQLLEQIG